MGDGVGDGTDEGRLCPPDMSGADEGRINIKAITPAEMITTVAKVIISGNKLSFF